MIKKIGFIQIIIIVITLLVIRISSGMCAISQEDLIKTTLMGYTESKKGNYTEAHELFKKVLDLASKFSWPIYNNSHIDKALQEYIEEHRYDWQETDEQKILGLMQVYNSVKHYFAGFEIVPELNWDELVIQYIPQVIEAGSIEEYYQLLQKLIANLNDNHTWIEIPKTIQENMDRPPISIEFTGNKFIITEVKDIQEIKEQNIYPGLEIKKVEEIPAREFFIENKLPYMPLSKVQRERLYKTFNLLEGEKDTKVKITVVDSAGKEQEVMLIRNSKMYKEEELPLIEMKELESGIVYFNFRAFWPSDTVVQKFEQEFNKLDLSKTKGMILDVRENSGGSSTVGDVVVSHIIDKSFKAWLFKARKRGFLKVMTNPFVKFGIWMFSLNKEWFEVTHTIKPYSGKRYLGPITVLISRYTCSAAEDFVAAIRESKRAVIIGETTRGGTGNGLYSILPGYGTLRVCVNIGAYVNGKIWQGVGIEPDIEVHKAIGDICRGYDSILAKGLDILKENMNKEAK